MSRAHEEDETVHQVNNGEEDDLAMSGEAHAFFAREKRQSM
jgi:hypothetical protein